MNTAETQGVFKWAKVVLIVLAIFLAAQALSSLKNLHGITPAYNSVSVTGEGEVVAIPDVATFSFTVSVDAKTVSEAQNQVTEKMDGILDGLKSLGVEDKDIKTTDYSIRPKYTYSQVICSSTFCPPSRQVQDGYTVSHVVSAKIRETDQVGKVVALAGERGASNFSNVSFTVDDMDSVLGEARAQAIRDAEAKAKLLAKELGVRLVRVVGFYDNSNVGPQPYYGEGFGGDAIKSFAVTTPNVPLGENKIVVGVTVIYEIR